MKNNKLRATLLGVLSLSCILTLSGSQLSSLTPADKHQLNVQKRMDNEHLENSPRKQAKDSKMESRDHKEAYNSLSPKNQKAYDSLDREDQKKVVETYKYGGNHQRTLTHILKHDQSANAPTHHERHLEEKKDSPATKAMKAEAKKDKHSDDEFFD